MHGSGKVIRPCPSCLTSICSVRHRGVWPRTHPILTAFFSGVSPGEVPDRRFSRFISLLLGSFRARFSSLMLAWCFRSMSSDLSMNYKTRHRVGIDRETNRQTGSESTTGIRGKEIKGEDEKKQLNCCIIAYQALEWACRNTIIVKSGFYNDDRGITWWATITSNSGVSILLHNGQGYL